MISLIIALAILGVVLYLINQLIMAAWLKQVINVIAIICVVVYVLRAFGVLGHDIPIPQFR